MCTNMDNIPETLMNRAVSVANELLPDVSRLRYENEYDKLCTWCQKENIKPSQVNDDILLVYMSELSKTMKPSTLWSKYSMVTNVLKVKENLGNLKFPKTVAFLKKKSVGFKPKKANVFTSDQISQFMINAPDKEWLLSKVILTFGIFGALRRDDLLRLSINDVKDYGSFIKVTLRDGKTHASRSFIITDDECTYQPCQLVRKYLSLRPSKMTSPRLFVGFRQGKCVAQHVGSHTISDVPKKVAQYLKLEQPESYTGHAIRRTSASMLVEGGADLLTLKRHGGWKSATVAEGYIEESINRKIDVSKKLFSKPSTSISNQNNSSLNLLPIRDITNSISNYNNSSLDSLPLNKISNNDEEVNLVSKQYFTIDDVISSEEDTVQNRNFIQENNKVDGTHSEVNVAEMKKNLKLPQKMLNISENQNCDFNIHFHFH